MQYRSILTVVTDGQHERSALPGAISLARALDADLDVLSLGVDEFIAAYDYAGANAMIEQQAMERARDFARSGETAVREMLEGSDVRWSVTGTTAHYGSLDRLVGGEARFADLVVLPAPYGEGRTGSEEAVLEAALFAGNVPVLVLPEDVVPTPFQRPVIAWNSSAEAIAAVRGALPFLIAARRCDVIIIDPPSRSADNPEPGARLERMLARHGVQARIAVLPSAKERTSETIARQVAALSGDLLVMGAYGHSRIREALLGGATRDILGSTQVPVLMSH